MALFGKTAAQWRALNQGSKGDIRDCATLEQLVVLSNLENSNSMLIQQGLPQTERIVQLNAVAIFQMQALVKAGNIKRLELKEPEAAYAAC